MILSEGRKKSNTNVRTLEFQVPFFCKERQEKNDFL